MQEQNSISKICSRNIRRKNSNFDFILRVINTLEINDFPNKSINCNEPEEAFRLLKDLLTNDFTEAAADFDIIDCLNKGALN